MKNTKWTGLVSPKTGKALYNINSELITKNGEERFKIKNRIFCLLESDILDEATRHEMNVFDRINTQDISYFRVKLFGEIINKILLFIHDQNKKGLQGFRIVEMGGGAGHWAKHIKEKFVSEKVFVCDLSFKSLECTSGELIPVFADIRCPIFENNSIHLASFWVSLHHLEEEDRTKALKEVAHALVEGGLLMIFEPNIDFWLRQIMYRSRLSRDVYVDEKEQALKFSELTKCCRGLGLTEVSLNFINPPYNINFLKSLKKWIIYLCIVEFLYWLDRLIFNPIFGNILSNYQCKFKKYVALYGMAIYRKERKS